MATIAQGWIKQGMEQGIKQGLIQGMEQGLERSQFASPLCPRV